MFKYKSPLSRLLEGSAKSNEDAKDKVEDSNIEKLEPIADLNVLRQVLAEEKIKAASFEDSEELLPEQKMPDFPDQEESKPVSAMDNMPDVLVIKEALSNEEPPKEEAKAEEPAPQLEVAKTVNPMTEAFSPAPEPTEAPEVVETPVAETPPAVAPAAPAPVSAKSDDRRDRVKTTFLGFERPDAHVQDLMEQAPVEIAKQANVTFPVGWLVVTSGPGRGASLTVTAGLMQIGRNDDQAIQLDFGDTGISRSSHAVIAYDPEDRKCYLGHGGKANLVRLNGSPVLATVPMSNGDEIRISETTMRFVALCDENFDWSDK
ncbi:FHA domain protein [Roseovarius albus]|uniref:FHA domain protein n=1 Tax=Roseovarius albus TaxID=1247867 RepID=A0A1X6YPF1_9RHOB|nr:FHA domain-containing protein [Roseovarius albus]SLN25509.1 FHA domain protein [Roseovarius albus]